jgi:enamine deaminase RidA (YjgF/YER057c/UK114 family)
MSIRQSSYSKAVRAGDLVFVAGHVSGHEGFEAQLEDCIAQLSTALKQCQATLADVVRLGVFLRRREDFARMNTIYERHFNGNPLPTRTTLSGIDFTKPETLVELDCIAHAPLR